MSWVAAATIGGSLIGGTLASKGAKDAAETQASAADRSSQLQKEMYDSQVARNQPYADAGNNALQALLARMGLTGEGGNTLFQLPTYDPLTADAVMAEPGYQFGLNQGTNSLQQILNARGQRFSGNAAKALTRYGNDYASGQFQNAWNRKTSEDTMDFNRRNATDTSAYNALMGIIGKGQASVNNQAAADQNLASNQSNNIWGAANADAASSIAQGNIWRNSINQGVSMYRPGSSPVPTSNPNPWYSGPDYTPPIDGSLPGGGW